MANRVPKNILIMRGADKNHPERLKGRNPPEPERGKIEAPGWLNEKAKVAFDQLAELTTGMGVLTLADHTSLAMVCDAYSDYIAAKETIDKHGLTYEFTNREGEKIIKANPAAAIKSDAWKRVMLGLGKFGLSPTEREKINIVKPKKPSVCDEF